MHGIGCNVSTSTAKERRGKTKFIDINLSLALSDIAKSEKDNNFIKKCTNTYFCLSTVDYKNGRIFGKQCKNRFCTTCNGIRKATLINQYKPILSNWEDPHFLTLTTKSCKSNELESQIAMQKKEFNKIIDKYEKRYKVGKSIKIVCLRTHESNFNPIKEWYNPHFHIITKNRAVAMLLMQEWIKALGNKKAKRSGQDIRQIKDLDYHLIETIKYGTKIFTDPEMKKGFVSKKKVIYIRAMYNVLKAFEGKKIISSYGFKLPNQVKEPKTETKLLNSSNLVYMPIHHDWINKETGSMLTRFLPNEEQLEIFRTINKTQQ